MHHKGLCLLLAGQCTVTWLKPPNHLSTRKSAAAVLPPAGLAGVARHQPLDKRGTGAQAADAKQHAEVCNHGGAAIGISMIFQDQQQQQQHNRTPASNITPAALLACISVLLAVVGLLQ